MPFLASEHHGKMIVLAMMVYAGEGPAAEAAVAPFRGACRPAGRYAQAHAVPGDLPA